LRSRDELEANTDIHFVDYGMTDDEVLETIQDNDRTIFVGATARFDPNWKIHALSPQSIEKFGSDSLHAILIDSVCSQLSTLVRWSSNLRPKARVMLSLKGPEA
jgi:hypothetical protein